MVVIFFTFFAVINYKKTFKKNILGTLLKCGIVTFLLNLWFIVPFLQSMGMEVKVADKDKITMIEGHSAYLSQLFGVFHTSNGISAWRSTQNDMPLSLGFPILLGVAVFLYIYIKKESWKLSNNKSFKNACICFVLGSVALFFSSNLCRWDNLKSYSLMFARLAGMVQFPWRYLGIATICFMAMIVFVLQIIEEHALKKCRDIMLLLVCVVIITEGHFMMEYINTQNEVQIYSKSSANT